ncbi:hypothetical protein JTE90_007490 [Oedothorax gibbosus]|uniref:Uncharacterized protein n=1 Tax=Oedothorax gibbosus TaxID=931172 RepID=A0AAV6TZT1_9ARAC|nr:hypothetical protein JTE90_007490 [Oedothorax gibbosus]
MFLFEPNLLESMSTCLSDFQKASHKGLATSAATWNRFEGKFRAGDLWLHRKIIEIILGGRTNMGYLAQPGDIQRGNKKKTGVSTLALVSYFLPGLSIYLF